MGSSSVEPSTHNRSDQDLWYKAPIQLDLFEPVEKGWEYKVIITNKKTSTGKVAKYHEGRGYQEQIFGELKTQGALKRGVRSGTFQGLRFYAGPAFNERVDSPPPRGPDLDHECKPEGSTNVTPLP